MNFTEIILIGIGLAMDACAVSMTNGLCYRIKSRQIFMMAFSFGAFQGVMPLLGYFIGNLFASRIAAFDHWIALLLLGGIGGKMIWDALHEPSEEKSGNFSVGMLMLQSVATSIDALAVGISFAAVRTDIWKAVSIIAVITFLLSVISVKIGQKIGDKLNEKAELFGGTVLILIGVKIFAEHLLAGH